MWTWIDIEAVLILGLLFDIFGAFVLAVPDLPTFARRFKFGRLRKARESLGYGGITSGDVGFDDIVQLHNEQQSNTQITPNDITEVSFGPDLDPVFSEGELVDFEVKNRLTFEYRDDFKPAGINFQEHGTLPEYYYQDILRVIDRGERKFRRRGILLIIFGFGLQLGSVLLF